MAHIHLAERLERRYRTFFASYPVRIPFEVRELDGSVIRLGAGEPAFTIVVADSRGARALASLDQFAIGVAYLDGWIDIQGDLMAALSIRSMFRDVHPIVWLRRYAMGDRAAISSHYDNDSDFFLTFLDRRHRCYTQGIFLSDDQSLEDAMSSKLNAALDAIGVRPGDHVLEVGGGWGAFMQFAARKGVQVTTLTLARESERYLNELIERERLPARVVREHALTFTSAHRFDAIVNMGVTEHLPDYRTSLQQYAALLRPGGRVYLDALAMRHGGRAGSTFMRRFIYPGKSMPLVLHDYLRHVAESPFELISVSDDRHNYYLTCAEWARRLDAAKDEVVRHWGEALYRRFRLFLWGSAASFDLGLVQAYRWVLYLPAHARNFRLNMDAGR
jgi:cyclopropane-fatty-acyl-phospholipid synthase